MTIATPADLSSAYATYQGLLQIEQVIAILGQQPSPSIAITLVGYNQVGPLNVPVAAAHTFLQQLQAAAVAQLATLGVTAT